MAREFKDVPAMRSKVPLLIGLAGPSGGGKTYSALRIATGMQRVSGGEIFMVDTENKRSLHYADKFKFRHVEFGSPFSSLAYLEAIQYCQAKGAGVIIVDSMSHEHEGPGGMLEAHEAETDRLAKLWGVKPSVAQLSAWAKPKQERRRLINTLLQIQCNFIFCFRAKEKLKIKKGQDPQPLGFMPIAGEEFVFEMTANALLLPGAGGVPTWLSQEIGERQMIKLPEQFRELFKESKPLDENMGEQMALWAKGDSSPEFVRLAAALKAATTEAAIKALEPDLKKAAEGKLVKDFELANLRSLYRSCLSDRKGSAAAPTPSTNGDAAGSTLGNAADEYRAAGGDLEALLTVENKLWEDLENGSTEVRSSFIDLLRRETRQLHADRAA